MGKAKNLSNRVSSYFIRNSTLGEKTKLLVSRIEKIKFIVVRSEIESLLLEANLIKKYNPMFNVKLTDGKAYPLIRITKKDDYPKVLIARRMEDKNSIYFGPYPNTGDMRLVLKTIRRIFPFQSVLNHPKRICFYYHLGLCPCPAVFDSAQTKKQYKKNIKHIVLFLSGKSEKIIKELEKERDNLSKKEAYENAQNLQKKIKAITLITNSVHKPFEYETNPNLSEDLRQHELDSLAQYLTDAGMTIQTPHRIECYDISNISGKYATGSMVVFVDGKKESSFYRRFRINPKLIGPNDFEMMKEVITRRLRHSEWDYPDLIVVDGGKGQISSALAALALQDISIPLIGLAKREETIITSDFKELSLPKNSPALHLVMRIRDEAHRFAITYHRKLRSKYFLGSQESS